MRLLDVRLRQAQLQCSTKKALTTGRSNTRKHEMALGKGLQVKETGVLIANHCGANHIVVGHCGSVCVISTSFTPAPR